MLMNRPGRSTRSRTQSASSVDLLPPPFDRFATECDRQKGEDPRQSHAGYRVHSALASAHEIEYSLYLTAMTLLGIIRHNTHAIW